MRSLSVLVLGVVCSVPIHANASGFTAISDAVTSLWQNQNAVRVGELRMELKSSEKVVQSVLDNGLSILRISHSNGEVYFYNGAAEINLRDFAASTSRVLNVGQVSLNGLQWEYIQTEKQTHRNLVYVTAFKTTYRGQTYYGYVRGLSSNVAQGNAMSFLQSLSLDQTRSLTGPDYKGKKYYLGWGAAMSFDPSNMHNEVKYDVLHTHDIFTKEVGGSYIGTKYTSYKDATSTNIKKSWTEIKNKIQSDDMYVQYSSGHGSESGLAVGVDYDQIRDQVLSFKAKESVIFIMACHSGGLVASFDEKKSEWQDMQASGRTLFVMASSKHSENSSTGPGTDPEEPNGANGTAGSAFGHALWKALIGHGDGEMDGVKDGYLSLDEISKFTVKKTEEVGGHTPVYTGAYDGNLLMNRVPSKAFLDSIGITSENLTDAEVIERVKALDAEMRM